MNGPEHYRDAELLLDCATGMARDNADPDEVATHLALAAVHARLAQVAATVSTAYGWADTDTIQAWYDATGVHPAEDPGGRP